MNFHIMIPNSQVISLRTFSQAAAQEGDDSGVSLTESAIQVSFHWKIGSRFSNLQCRHCQAY